MRQKRNKGQAIIEYLLLVLMVAITIAVSIRGMNRTIYGIWSGLAREIARPCSTCESKAAPDLP